MEATTVKTDYKYEELTPSSSLELLAYHEEQRRLHALAVARLSYIATELHGFNYDFEECPEVEAIINPQDDDDKENS